MTEFVEKYINPEDGLSLKYYRGLKNSLDTAREEGKIEVAQNMLAMGMSVEMIIQITGLSEEEISRLA